MKKRIALLLSLLLIFCCMSIPAHAEQNKIAPNLIPKVEALADGETLPVAVWVVVAGDYKDVGLTAYVNQIVFERYGLRYGMCHTREEIDAYQKAYNRVLTELETANIPTVQEKLGIGYEDIIAHGCNMMILYLTKEQIEAAAEMDEVEFVEYAAEAFAEPEEPSEDGPFENLDPDYGKVMTEADFIEAIRQAYTDGSVTDEMIHIERFEPVGESEYVIRYTVDGEAYDENGEYPVGAFTLSVADGRQPMIYCTWEHQFRTLQSAYDSKIIGHGALKQIAALDWVDLTRTVWLPGDSDDDFSITILDATHIQRYLAGLPDRELTADADADRDGRITILDATCIQRHLAGLDKIEPSGQPLLLDGIYHDGQVCYQVIGGVRYEVEDP